MVKKEFNEIHSKIDKILELTNNTNVRLSVVETKLNYTSNSVDDQKNTMSEFMKDTVCQRVECNKKFKEIDSTLSKGQGAVWVIGFLGVILGVVGSAIALVSGFIKS